MCGASATGTPGKSRAGEKVVRIMQSAGGALKSLNCMKTFCILSLAVIQVSALTSCLGPQATRGTAMGATVGAATAGPVGAAAGAAAGNVYGGVRDRVKSRKNAAAAASVPDPAPAPPPSAVSEPGAAQPPTPVAGNTGVASGTIVEP